MSNSSSAMSHPSLQVQLGHLDGAAIDAVVAQAKARRSAVASGERQRDIRPSAPAAVGGWWAYCAQAGSDEA